MKRQLPLLVILFLLWFSGSRGQNFTIHDVLISSPVSRIFDIEVDQHQKRICWQSPDDDKLWVCRFDTSNWTLTVPDGKETLVDSTLTPYNVTSNSGEWGYDLFGNYLVYSKNVARKRYIALAIETQSGWAVSTLMDAPHRMNPHATQNPSDSFASIHYIPTTFGNFTKYKSRRNLSMEFFIPGFRDAHWAAGEQFLTGILNNEQVGLYDPANPGIPAQITFENGKIMSKPYMWRAPELGYAHMLFAVANGEKIIVYRESVPGTFMFRHYMSFTSPSANPLYIKFGSPEPIVYMGHSYLTFMASSSECETSCYPGEIWLARLDSAAPLFRMVSDSSIAVRSDPESLETSDSLYVLYTEVIGGNTPEAIYRLRRCDTGIGFDLNTGTRPLNENPAGEAVVFPNPFRHRILLRNPTGREFCRLTDTHGKILWSGRHIDRRDFSDLPAGVYLLEVEKGEKKTVVKLLKE